MGVNMMSSDTAHVSLTEKRVYIKSLNECVCPTQTCYLSHFFVRLENIEANSLAFYNNHYQFLIVSIWTVVIGWWSSDLRGSADPCGDLSVILCWWFNGGFVFNQGYLFWWNCFFFLLSVPLTFPHGFFPFSIQASSKHVELWWSSPSSWVSSLWSCPSWALNA